MSELNQELKMTPGGNAVHVFNPQNLFMGDWEEKMLEIDEGITDIQDIFKSSESILAEFFEDEDPEHSALHIFMSPIPSSEGGVVLILHPIGLLEEQLDGFPLFIGHLEGVLWRQDSIYEAVRRYCDRVGLSEKEVALQNMNADKGEWVPDEPFDLSDSKQEGLMD